MLRDLAASGVFIEKISSWPKRFALAIAVLAIAANLVEAPINLDGTKKPFWGSYLIDTTDHYYPYKDALIWLKEQHTDQRLLVTGLYYPYLGIDFYFDQLNWHPDFTQLQIGNASEYNANILAHKPNTEDVSRIFAQAEADGYQVVLFHLLIGQSPPLPQEGPFRLEKTFMNQAHTLMVYYKNP